MNERNRILGKCYRLGEIIAMTCMKCENTGVIGSSECRRMERANRDVQDIGADIGANVAKAAFDDGFAAVFRPSGTYKATR